jgi:hypothetical protein
MTKKHTSLHDEYEAPFLVPGKKGIDWKATKTNLLHLSRAAYSSAVLMSQKYICIDDLRDPDSVIEESLRDNVAPAINMIIYCEKMGLPDSLAKEVRQSLWLKKTKEDVITDLSTEAQKMRKRKIYLRKHREDRKKNGLVSIQE